MKKKKNYYPSRCLACDHEKPKVKMTKLDQEFRGLRFCVEVPLLVCDNCEFRAALPQHVDFLVRETKNKFKQLLWHGIAA